MMITSTGVKILVGISLHPDENKELISWAINVLAQPNDCIVAIHVLVGEEPKKPRSKLKKQSRIRLAKAHVISVLGEFSRTCQSKQVHLEARIGFSSSVAKGLIDDAKAVSADYLLLRRPRSLSNKSNSHQVTKYCFDNAPEGCTIVSVGKRREAQQQLQTKTYLDKSSSSSINSDEDGKLSSTWLITKNGQSDNRTTSSSVEKQIDGSPRTVLDELEGDSNSTEEDDTFSLEDSSVITQSPVSSSIRTNSFNHQSDNKTIKKGMSPGRFFTSLFTSPMKKNRSFSFSNKEKPQPLLTCFSYEEISNATNCFHSDNMVGQGGYSEVYKGNLSDGRTIAVKRLAKDNKDANKEKEFLMELGIIVHVCHPNTATLVGCCIENGLYLIFNFSQNGNLESALHDNKTGETLDWSVRYKIAIGVARGLHYLHKCCKHRIIHRDIKASNVLLGPDYEPQITDFGLAKWLPNKWTHHAVIPIEGTFGYLAPEYFMNGIVDEKTDVFAFGVLLLEIITGRKPVDSSRQNLLLWAKPYMESGDVLGLIDPTLEEKYDSDQMQRLILTASFCVRQSSTWRPSMSEVLEILINGEDSEFAKSWRVTKFSCDELDDYSLFFGYHVPSTNDINLEDLL